MIVVVVDLIKIAWQIARHVPPLMAERVGCFQSRPPVFCFLVQPQPAVSQSVESILTFLQSFVVNQNRWTADFEAINQAGDRLMNYVPFAARHICCPEALFDQLNAFTAESNNWTDEQGSIWRTRIVEKDEG